MILEDAQYRREGAYPVLDLTVDGTRTRILPAEHGEFWDAGLVYLGPAFEDRLPEIEHRSRDGTVTMLRGFTGDRRIFLMQARLSNASADGTFRSGPVSIPRPDDVP